MAMLLFWLCSTVIGFYAAFVALSEIRTDEGRWDAVIPLQLAQATNWSETRLRTREGGAFRVWLSTVGFDEKNTGRPFAGRVDIVVYDPSGREQFAGGVGGEGATLFKTVNSGWAKVGEIKISAAWLKPWVLRARVTAGDENFRGMDASVILRKVRPEIGMGGLIFYVLVFPAVALVLLSIFLAFGLFTRGLRWPAAVTFLASLPLWPLL